MTPARATGILGDMDIVELSRRLENLIRFGTIHSVDHPARRCRVQSGELVTQWLRWFEYRAGETTTWNPPTVGEQCVVFSPSGEPGAGMVFYGAPSDVIDTPSHSPDEHVTRYPDGTTHLYNHAAGLHEIIYADDAQIRYAQQGKHLEAIGIETGLIRAAASLTLDTPLTHITGQCVVDQLLTYNNGLSGKSGTNGNHVTGGFHNTGGETTSNGIVLETHVHGDVYPGLGNTGLPK